jgi:hypothetical protein
MQRTSPLWVFWASKRPRRAALAQGYKRKLTLQSGLLRFREGAGSRHKNHIKDGLGDRRCRERDPNIKDQAVTFSAAQTVVTPEIPDKINKF